VDGSSSDRSAQTTTEDLRKVRGWIYVLTHPNMPGILKVGQSSHDPSNRASELYTTGLPNPFDIEYVGIFENYVDLERSVHSFLGRYRANNRREFFAVDLHVAVSAIRSCSPTPPLYEQISERAKRSSDQLSDSDRDFLTHLGILSSPKKTCSMCSGTGKVRTQQGFFTLERNCPTCKGEA
jgi:hypothetical protein